MKRLFRALINSTDAVTRVQRLLSCLTLGEYLGVYSLCIPKFSYTQNKDCISNVLIGWLTGLYKLIHIKHTMAPSSYLGLPWWLGGKEPTCLCRRLWFDPRVGKIPWKRKWHSTPVFLPGKIHGQRGLVGYSPWGHKESDMTWWLNNSKAHTKLSVKMLTTQSCRTCGPTDYRPLGSAVQEYWSGLPFPSPGDLPTPRDCTQGSCIAGSTAGRFFTIWATKEAQSLSIIYDKEPGALRGEMI